MDVPPQQFEWYVDCIHENKIFGTHFPKECIELIASFMDNLISLDQAKKNREFLMKERSKGEKIDIFEQFYRKITYCEH